MAAQFCGSAHLDMMHDLNLFIWQRVRLPVAVPVTMENICHFPLLFIIGGIKLIFFHCRPPCLHEGYQGGF
jgi:hypothetical protein